MQRLPFEKYQGLGNDFLVIEVKDADALGPEQVKQLCDRNFGVGGDGVLLVSPGQDGAKARMTVINADGSRPEMCGNGLRCVAFHLVRKHATGNSHHEFTVDTDAGAKLCRVSVRSDAAGGAAEAQVTIGLGRAAILGELTAVEGDTEHRFIHVDIGNPHAILFDSNHDEAAIDAFAPKVAKSVLGGLNVEFVRERSRRHFDLIVHERGVGRTLACGTGAGATAVALVNAGRADKGVPLQIELPGGPLTITVEGQGDVIMTGPARHVFSGEVALP